MGKVTSNRPHVRNAFRPETVCEMQEVFESQTTSAIQLKFWFLAIRPRTLPISLPPLLAACSLAAKNFGHLNWALALCALICSLGIQIATNLFNDALDFKKGTDGEGRIGPKRMTQEGALSYKAVMAGGCLSLGCALIFAIPLMLAGGWPLAFIVAISVSCAYLYTGGPWPLSYIGVSDFFVLLFFGWVSTGAVYYLLTQSFDKLAFIAGTQIGLLATVPHAINNLRDLATDARANKKTLAVRFGGRFAKIEIASLSLLPFLLGLLWQESGYFWAAALPFLALPFIFRNLVSVWKTDPSPAYNQFLVKSAQCQLLFGSLLSGGIYFG